MLQMQLFDLLFLSKKLIIHPSPQLDDSLPEDFQLLMILLLDLLLDTVQETFHLLLLPI